MMIKFSWKKINDKLNWNAYLVLEYFFLTQGIKSPPYLRPKAGNIKYLITGKYKPGSCYLINPDAVLKNAKSPNELYMYLELASKRSLFDYRVRGIKTLSLAFVPEYLREWVELNPMLEVKNGNVYFKYEQE